MMDDSGHLLFFGYRVSGVCVEYLNFMGFSSIHSDT